ncbi:ABC transporter ATP-binding protein [Peptacetobacter hominis]|uniref:ABC transporter ATP-binding protein n=1 Tax=Peptacetobacter hominis TaxID=2743610 RepID=A0A544QWE9_9FIRM|nr:ABC transporter ATP-binding protein [Peptacetobacter hominis]TQQ85013.1 ABC transporter ATP-binding protein [Peptacetobacter hominis]
MIRTENLKKVYGKFELDCTMSVKPGYITGLIGKNGSGKTTLFKSILGLISVDGGKAEILGKDIRKIGENEKQKIGVALSDSGFSGYLTIKDMIIVFRHLYKEFDEKEFVYQVNRFSLPMNKKIKDFSTGMKARLKVIAAMSHNADILILDEPTAGLDVIARDEIIDLLRDYMEKDENRSILISSHISGDIENLCDDIYMIDDGKIIVHEDTDVLLSDYGILKVDSSMFENIEKDYILRYIKEGYGYRCLTDQKIYYKENYPDVIIENAGIDDLMTMMIRGEKL